MANKYTVLKYCTKYSSSQLTSSQNYNLPEKGDLRLRFEVSMVEPPHSHDHISGAQSHLWLFIA